MTYYDILGSSGNGGNAEYVVAHADKFMRMPQGFDFVTAAAAPLAYQTAWRALIKRAKVPAITQLSDHAADRMSAVVDHVFWRLVQLALVLAAVSVLGALAYRAAVRRS